jgi:hypothetical protein
MKETHTIQLTHSQVINLKEFLEFNFIPIIREDDTIDNINYLVDMCDAYKKLSDLLKEKGGAE